MTSDTGIILDKHPEYPIQLAFQTFYHSYAHSHEVSPQQKKAAQCISHCKTGELGYILVFCPECGYKRLRSCSCNSRNCPCCQAPLEHKWVMERNAELIPGIAYYHVVFTLPHELNPLILDNPEALYKLLFSAASDTLITLCRDRKYMGATPGIVAVLHTWGQKLNFHPHLHICLSGGGLTDTGRFVETKHKGFIIPRRVVGRIFRGKFMEGLKTLYEKKLLCLSVHLSHLVDSVAWGKYVDHLYTITWIPFLKETFNGKGNAIKYLARYAYRTAISNSRVLEVNDEAVFLSYTDYADHNQKKELRLSGEEFIGRFLLHILPQGVHRVRSSGFLANCVKAKRLTLIGKLRDAPYKGNPTKGKSMAEILMKIYGTDICHCPVCQSRIHMTRLKRPPTLMIAKAV